MGGPDIGGDRRRGEFGRMGRPSSETGAEAAARTVRSFCALVAFQKIDGNRISLSWGDFLFLDGVMAVSSRSLCAAPCRFELR